jgi:PTH1 family peptidyl-tRNA hydrolase
MVLIVGLGNPGTQYEKNRHNVGFMAVDAIHQAYCFSPWKNRFHSLASEGLLEGRKIYLLKPQTFMNLSGQSVGEIARFYKIDLKDILVIHDELDLPEGKVRIKTGGGHGGHNGLKSIDAHLGKEYRRLRLGIGHPGHKALVNKHVSRGFFQSRSGLAGTTSERNCKTCQLSCKRRRFCICE